MSAQNYFWRHHHILYDSATLLLLPCNIATDGAVDYCCSLALCLGGRNDPLIRGQILGGVMVWHDDMWLMLNRNSTHSAMAGWYIPS